MTFFDSIKRGLRLIKLDGDAAVEIASDSGSTVNGWLVIFVAGLLGSLAISIKQVPFSFLDYLTNLGYSIVFSALAILIIHGLAKLFGGQSTLIGYFRAQSHAHLLNWISIVTAVELAYVGNLVGWAISLWSIIISVVVLKNVHRLSTWKAIIVALALPLILLVLLLIGALAYFGALRPDNFLPSNVALKNHILL